MDKIPTYLPEDFNSNNGILTTIWGPVMWLFLHCMSFNYPINPTKQDKRKYQTFVTNLVNVLPCGKCRANLKLNFKKLPLTAKDMESRHTFSKYVYNLHECVNKMLHKNSHLSYDDVRETFEHFRARCALPSAVKTEKGCVVPLVGKKSKCVIKIVPQQTKGKTFSINKTCIKSRRVTRRRRHNNG